MAASQGMWPRIFVFFIVALLMGCDSNDDDDDGGPVVSPILGSWEATVLDVDAVDQIPAGMTFTLFFDDQGTYDIFVQNDQVGLICAVGGTCQESGDYEVSATRITFDPDEPSENRLGYSVGGGQLTINGSIDGFVVAGVFSRRVSGRSTP